MLRALYTSATGMKAQETLIDATANNLANVNTVGFKRHRPEFSDLVYHTVRNSGGTVADAQVYPTGLQIGHGVRTSGTTKVFNQGSPRSTERDKDIMIEGPGFLQVTRGGETLYTRAGNLAVNSDGILTTASGHPLIPNITVPTGANIQVSGTGVVTTFDTQNVSTQLGTIQLVNFINPEGLENRGDNLYASTDGSGQPEAGDPGSVGEDLAEPGTTFAVLFELPV